MQMLRKLRTQPLQNLLPMLPIRVGDHNIHVVALRLPPPVPARHRAHAPRLQRVQLRHHHAAHLLDLRARDGHREVLPQRERDLHGHVRELALHRRLLAPAVQAEHRLERRGDALPVRGGGGVGWGEDVRGDVVVALEVVDGAQAALVERARGGGADAVDRGEGG
jgi:hypothetical protein